MFTGLIEATGKIREIGRKGVSFQVSISSGLDVTRTDIGASISVDGVCLTVVRIEKDSFAVDVSRETLERTTLKEKKKGDEVNLERALRLSDRLAGHLVSGHIDGTGTITSMTRKDNSLVVTISTSSEVARYLVSKGSVALDGISLTINEVQGTSFSLAIIPHTAQVTTVGKKSTGDRLNIETDIIGKYVERFLQQAELVPKEKGKSSSITQDFLTKYGFT